jgi:preprotein translocase subunit SecA
MSLYQKWTELVESQQTQVSLKKFWQDYFDQEKKNYAQILSEGSWELEGTVKELADRFEMDAVLFTGFLDGINTSLAESLEIEGLEEDTPVKLSIIPEKLYFNMLDAKADWLYNLPQWDEILTKDRRREIYQEYRTSKMAVSTKIGRNDPCPCGSGKKYKKCCGA